MKPKPLSLTSRLIVPFIGAMANSETSIWSIGRTEVSCEETSVALRPSALDRRRQAYEENGPEYTPDSSFPVFLNMFKICLDAAAPPRLIFEHVHTNRRPR